MSTTRHLTQIRPNPSRAELEAMLEQAGLELWRAPEGFWVIRLKVAPPVAASPRRTRRGRRR